MKNTSLIKIIAIAIILPLFTGSVFAQKKIQLKYKLNKGDKYSYNLNLDQDINFEANGQAVSLNQLMNFYMIMTIDNAENAGNYKIISTIDRITMNQKIFGMELNYDSGDSSTFTSGMGKQIGDQMNKIIGKKFTTEIDTYGNIQSIDMSEISDNKDISGNINKNAEFTIYPDHKIAVGESWETDSKPLTNSSMKIHTKYTLTKVKGKKAFISFESTITSSDKSETNVNGTQTGKMIVNKKTGWILHSEIDQELKIDIDQGGMTIPAEISGSTEINSKKIN
jgi:hypothetical protein